MGSAASTQSLLTSELAKPLDANDLDEKAAKAEVVRLRSLLRQHEQALLKSSMATAGGGGGTTRASLTVKISPAVAPAETEASQGAPVKSPNGCKSPYSRADVAKFDNNHAASFNVEDCPQIRDYLINEFSRFAGADQVLEWDEFWRFMQNLELRLSDQEIATLRQKADINHDGVIEWDEMLTVVQPVLGKYWQAQLAGAPEYTHWTELHWETHHTVQKDGEGYTRKGTPFYVNKVTGQNSWEKPGILTRHASIDELKKDRNMQQAPSLEAVLKHAFDKHSTSGVVLSRDQFWKIVTEELHLDPALSQPELRALMANADLNKDGAIDRNEFVVALTPILSHVFQERKGANEWVAITYYHDDDKEYLYWYNRVTGKSTWDNPVAKRKSVVSRGTVRGSVPAASVRGSMRGSVSSSGDVKMLQGKS